VEHEIQHLVELLSRAASQVTDEYFQLPVVDADAVYRERVYCYELYHARRGDARPGPFSVRRDVLSGHRRDGVRRDPRQRTQGRREPDAPAAFVKGAWAMHAERVEVIGTADRDT
jgi:hypothetical protein